MHNKILKLECHYLSMKLPLSKKNYVTSVGAVSHIAHYQVSFFKTIYFDFLPIVSSAFKRFR